MLYRIKKGGAGMREVKWNRVLMAIFLYMPIFIFITGCVTETLSKRAIPPVESQLIEEGGETAISLYHDFKDVPVPKELEIKRENSFAFQTTEFTIGLLTFSGNVDPDSLMSFFTTKMPEDGWRFLSSFKSPKNIMFFLKENRFCIITITSKTFAAEVEILVTPSFQSK
jgi:hypothetical protein